MPEAPLIIPDEPEKQRHTPFRPTVAPDDRRPPPIVWPEIPAKLGLLAGAPNETQPLEELATAEFKRKNPRRREWENQRSGAEWRRHVLVGRAARLARRAEGTDDWKTIPGGPENGLQKSRLGSLSPAALLLLGAAAFASALNVAATYAIEAGAWAQLIEHQWTAYLFMLVAPVGGFAGICGFESWLQTDRARAWFGRTLAAATLLLWAAWLIEFDHFYALQTLIGDAAGRRLPDNLAHADAALHGRLLLTQLIAEVLSGGTIKLMLVSIDRRNHKELPIASELLKCIETKYDQVCAAMYASAAFVGSIDDFSDSYEKNLVGYIALCKAELHRIRSLDQANADAKQADAEATAATARAVAATARAEFLIAKRSPAKEIGNVTGE